MHVAGPGGNGFNPSALECGIGLGYQSLGLVKGMGALPSMGLNSAVPPTAEYTQYFRPNSTRTLTTVVWTGSPAVPTRGWAAATSLHTGIVNVVYADGHAGSVSQDVNWAVWASLHSPTGVRYGQAPISDKDY